MKFSQNNQIHSCIEVRDTNVNETIQHVVTGFKRN